MSLFEVFTGLMPFQDLKSFVEIFQFFKTSDTFEPSFPLDCSEGLKDFIRQCLAKDARRRPTAIDLLVRAAHQSHQWLRQHLAKPCNIAQFIRSI